MLRLKKYKQQCLRQFLAQLLLYSEPGTCFVRQQPWHTINCNVRMGRSQDGNLITSVLEAISVLVTVEAPGTNAIRQVLDSKSFTRVATILSSETDPKVLERGLDVVLSLGTRSGTLTSDEIHVIGPVIGKILLYVLRHSATCVALTWHLWLSMIRQV